VNILKINFPIFHDLIQRQNKRFFRSKNIPFNLKQYKRLFLGQMDKGKGTIDNDTMAPRLAKN